MKNILTIYLLIFSLLTFGQSKTQIGTDTVIIGKPGSTSSKRIKLGSTQEIRTNSTTNKIEFAHDGTNFKPLGSGSGSGGSSGGINLITNESFEDPITTGWSNTGGTFTQESYLNGTETDAKFARFVATAAGQYFETPLITVPTNFSGGCQADFKKVSVSADDLFKVEILDSSSNVLATANVKKSSWVKFPTLNTTCPTPGSQFRLRVTSLAAGTIDSDYGYLGSNQNLVNIAQAKFFGGVKITNCAAQWSLSSTSYANFNPQTTCSYTYYGNAVADTSFGTTQLPAVKFSQLPPGEYLIQYEGLAGNNSSTSTSFRFSDGTNSTDADSSLSTNNFIPGFSGKLTTNSTQSNVTIQVQGKAATGSPLLHGTSLYSGTIRVWHFPSSQEQAVNTDQASWFIDANIGGANPDLGIAAVTSYSEITNASLDMVLNSGSSSAKIPCSGTNSPTGLTCAAGSESVGVVMNIPYAGLFEVCMDFTHDFGIQPNGDAGATFQLVETALNSNAIIQEGKTRVSTRAQQGASSVQQARATPFRLCGNFNFTSAGEKAIRLMYEQGIGGTIFSSVIYGDRSSSQGQRDIRITAYPRLSAYNRPILLDSPIVTASYWLSAAFTASTTIPINFDSKEFDSHNAVTTSPTAWKFTAPISGTYLISGYVTYSAGGSAYIRVYKNGAFYKTLAQIINGSQLQQGTPSAVIKLSAGEYIDIRPDTSLAMGGNASLASNSASNITITRIGL